MLPTARGLTVSATLAVAPKGAAGGVLAALAAAACFAAASVAQHRAAARVEPSRPLDPRLLLRLLRQPLWLVGGGADVAGLLLQVVALAKAPVVLVQPLLVAALLLAVPLAAALDRRRPVRAEVAGVLLCTAGLLTFLAVAQARPGRSAVPFAAALPTLGVAGAVAVAVTVSVRRIRPGPGRAVVLAAGCGVLYGVSSALIKLVTAELAHPWRALGSWPLIAVVVVGGAGLLLNQNAFQAGALAAPLATLTIVEPVTAAVVGLVLLGERVATGAAHLAAYAGIVVAVVAGVLLLALHTPQVTAAGPPGRGDAPA